MTLQEVLRGGRQCDEDGTEIIMSRQACCEAADALDKYEALVSAIKSARERRFQSQHDSSTRWMVELPMTDEEYNHINTLY